MFRRKNLHIVTLNSKLLHFGQELQFDRGRSFGELMVHFSLTLTSCFFRTGEGLHFIAQTSPLYTDSHGQTSSCQIVLSVHQLCTFSAPISYVYCPFPAVAILCLCSKMNCTITSLLLRNSGFHDICHYIYNYIYVCM